MFDNAPSSIQIETQVVYPLEMGEVLSKVCSGSCGEELPLAAFSKSTDGKFGRVSRCKLCRAEEARVIREASPSTEEQKEAARVRTRAWNTANKSQKAATGKAWAQANPEKGAARTTRWRKRNPEKYQRSQTAWVEANRERYARDWQDQNRDLFRSLQKRWRTEHPGHWRTRAESFKKVQSDFTYEQWLEVLEEYNLHCAYCLQGHVPLTMDHVVPISKGGPHTRDNIVPACRSCNSRKKDRSIFTMLAVNPLLKGGA